MRFALVIGVWLLTSSPVLAQDTRIPVAVWHKGDDQVGQRLAFALNEAIRGSRSFRFVDHEISPAMPRIDVHLVSVPGEAYRVSTAMAYTVAYDHASVPGWGILLSSGVSSCGLDRVEGCAKGILPNIDAAVDFLRRGWPELWVSLITGDLEYSEQQTPDAFSGKSAALSKGVDSQAVR